MKKYKNIDILKFESIGDYVTIDWTLGNYCNFKCNYCFGDLNTGTFRVPKLNDTIKSNIRHIVDECRKNGKHNILFNLSGGEPTMYHDFSELSAFLKTLGKVGVITNGSRTEEWWKANVDKLDEVIISHHLDFAESAHTIKVIDALIDRVGLGVHVIMHDQKFQESLSFFKLLTDRYLGRNMALTAKLLRNTPTLIIDYPKNYKEEMDKLEHKVHRREAVRNSTVINLADGTQHDFKPFQVKDLTGIWKGYMCSAPLEFIQINQYGEIGKLSCGHVYTELTNIYSDDFKSKFKLPEQAQLCQRNRECGCIGLLSSTKFLPT